MALQRALEPTVQPSLIHTHLFSSNMLLGVWSAFYFHFYWAVLDVYVCLCVLDDTHKHICTLQPNKDVILEHKSSFL